MGVTVRNPLCYSTPRQNGMSRRGRSPSLALPFWRGVVVLFRDAFFEIYRELRIYSSPVFSSACPFLRDVDGGQIQHLEQAVIGWENALVFGHFPELTVKSLDSVRRVN